MFITEHTHDSLFVRCFNTVYYGVGADFAGQVTDAGDLLRRYDDHGLVSHIIYIHILYIRHVI